MGNPCPTGWTGDMKSILTEQKRLRHASGNRGMTEPFTESDTLYINARTRVIEVLRALGLGP